jgi:hypothetical protein
VSVKEEALKDPNRDWLERHRRLVQNGQHESILIALTIAYDNQEPLPEWLYRALVKWLVRTETPQQSRARRQREKDERRWGMVEYAKWFEGVRGPAALGHASGAAEDTPVAGTEWAMEDSHKKTSARLRRAGIDNLSRPAAKRRKKVPK